MTDLEHLRARDGTPLAYRVIGDGPVQVTVLHSLALDGAWFEEFAAALGGRARVLLPDLRGHGASGPLREGETLATIATDVFDLWDHLGVSSSAVVGISMGGMVAQSLAAQEPERVDSLVLIATIGAFSDEARAGAESRIATVRSPGGMASMADQVIDRWLGPDATAEVHGRAREQFLATDATQHARALSAMTQVGEADLGSLDTPVLVLAPVADESTPLPAVRELAESIPGATFGQLPGSHLHVILDPHSWAGPVAGFLGLAPDSPPPGGGGPA